MKDFSSLRFEVWSDGKSDMIAIRAERPEDSEGLRYVWFVLTREELYRLVSGKVSTVEDGNHKLVMHGDQWFFYDLDLGVNKKAGKLEVSYYSANMPTTFMRAVRRLAERTWNRIHKGRVEAEKAGTSKYDLPHRVEIEVSQQHRDNSSRLYGQGKGQVEVVFPPQGMDTEKETKERFTALLSNKDFLDKADRLQQIARNSTRGFHQTAKLFLSKDADGFYWTAVSPSGKRILCGGLVNHSRDGGNDWSIHT